MRFLALLKWQAVEEKKKKKTTTCVYHICNQCHICKALTGKYFDGQLILHKKQNIEIFFQIQRLSMKYKYLKGKMNFRTVCIFICL